MHRLSADRTPGREGRLTYREGLAEAGICWEFSLLADSTEMKRQLLIGGDQLERQTIETDLGSCAGKEITLLRSVTLPLFRIVKKI